MVICFNPNSCWPILDHSAQTASSMRRMIKKSTFLVCFPFSNFRYSLTLFSKFSFEYLLLPPRSAVKTASLWLTSQVALRTSRPPTQHGTELAMLVMYKWSAWAPSIFRASSFGWWVVTHSLADSAFHGHRPTVHMNQHLLWVLGERILWHFNITFGSSRIAIRAYPLWPTNDHHSTAEFN